MRRKTIGLNPLDELGPAKGKGRTKKKIPPAAPHLQAQIRDVILKKPHSQKKNPIQKWIKSVLGRRIF